MSARSTAASALHGANPARLRRPPPTLVLGVLAFLSVLAILFGAALGSAGIPVWHEVLILLDLTGLLTAERVWDETDAAILLQLRLPRVVGAFVVGAGLATAGVLMQGVFRNPLADPYVLGSSAGAGLGAVVALTLTASFAALGFSLVPVFAFVGALTSTLIVYALARVGPRTSPMHLLLAGVAVSSLLASAMSFLMLYSRVAQTQLQSIFAWLLGGVALAGWQELRLVLPLLALALLAAWTMARALDAFAVGEEGAANLGIGVERAKLLTIGIAALLTALAVSISGLVAFVGLIVPHGVRLMVGPSHRLLIPSCALAGGAFLVLVDLLGRTIVAPGEVPVGLLTSLLGAPFFLWLLRRTRGSYAA
ncbi:MAG: iron ABC transporter permease [Chloroflexota bacterium]|nr:iron ABC transporter permease [Chloroflexota bacterium]